MKSRLIRIGTWNLDWAYPAHEQDYISVLAKHPADVWVLTETTAAVVPPGFEHHRPAPIRPRDDTDKWTQDSTWVSIWSRWEVKAIPVHADPHRVTCARIAVPGVAPLLVYGTVFPWNSDVLYRDRDAKQQAIQRQFDEMSLLQRKHKDCHFVLAGDFNQFMRPQKMRIPRTHQRAIEDGLSTLGVTCVTAPAHVSQSWPHAVIDHIAVDDRISSRFTFKSAWEAQAGLSDHGGIVVQGHID